MEKPTAETILAEIQRRIDVAEELADDPTEGRRDLDCYYMASQELNSLADWITARIMLGEG